MTHRDGDTVYVEAEDERTCAYCRTVAETRPYGVGGVRICFGCGMLPENVEETMRRYHALFMGDDEEM